MSTAEGIVHWALEKAEVEILQKLQGVAADSWVRITDEDGNPSVPSSERQVLVFLSGDRDGSAPRNPDQAHGLAIGWFDHDKRCWYVHGQRERYVTHWREEPADPELVKKG